MGSKSLKKNAIYAFFKTFMNIAFPIITFPYASRILTPESIGKVNFSNSIIQYFIILASLGINTYATREAAKLKDDKEKLSTFAQEIFTINLISTFISYILFFILLFKIQIFKPYFTIMLISCTKIFFNLISFDWLYTAEEEFKYITLRSIFFQIISLIFLFLFVKSPTDTEKYAIFGIISSVGSNLFNFFNLRKFINFKFQKLYIKKHLKPIFIFFGTSIVISIYTILDTSMLGFMSTAIEVGYYSVSIKIINMITSLFTAVISILLPRLSLYLNTQLINEYKSIIIKTINIMIILTIPSILGLIILAKPIIFLLSGTQYQPSIKGMIIMSPTIFMCVFASIAGTILTSKKKEKISFYACFIGSIINIILNSLLIPKFGYIGATIGTVITQTIVMIHQIIPEKEFFLNKKIYTNLFSVCISALIMCIAIIFIKHIIKNNFLLIVISVISGIIIYSICLFIMKNKTFIEYINSLKYKK